MCTNKFIHIEKDEEKTLPNSHKHRRLAPQSSSPVVFTILIFFQQFFCCSLPRNSLFIVRCAVGFGKVLFAKNLSAVCSAMVSKTFYLVFYRYVHHHIVSWLHTLTPNYSLFFFWFLLIRFGTSSSGRLYGLRWNVIQTHFYRFTVVAMSSTSAAWTIAADMRLYMPFYLTFV